MNHYVFIVAVWILCGVSAFGFLFAHFQGKYPEIASKTKTQDYFFCGLMSATGPIVLAVVLLTGRYGYGWRVK
jgi:hypothetical protein